MLCKDVNSNKEEKGRGTEDVDVDVDANQTGKKISIFPGVFSPFSPLRAAKITRITQNKL